MKAIMRKRFLRRSLVKLREKTTKPIELAKNPAKIIHGGIISLSLCFKSFILLMLFLLLLL
jgi:hypothetical protein